MPSLPRPSLVLLLALTACGQTAVTETPPEPAPLCAPLFDAYTTWAKACGRAELSSLQQGELVAHCEAHAALPGIDVPPAAFHECAGAIAASSCAVLPLHCLTPLGGSSPFNQPTRVWVGSGSIADYELFPRVSGTLATGAACDVGDQCQSGTCTSYDQCGVCADVRALGESCGATALCATGICDSGVCVVPGSPEGSACQAPKGASGCLPSLYCPNGTCVPRLHVGDACPDGALSFEACPVGSVCHASVCQSIATMQEGQACDGVTAVCSGEGIFCLDGVCRQPVAGVGLGGSCGLDVCVPGLMCSYASCAVPAQEGEPCLGAVACAANLLCLSDPQGGSRCGAPRGEGEACGGLDECGPELFCDLSGTASSCRRAAVQGEACGDGSGPCMDSLACRDGMCGALDECSVR
jgi:hypothetical protein